MGETPQHDGRIAAAGFQKPGQPQVPPGEVPLPAARADLQISPQLYLGRTVYVAKDPASLSYYRLQPAEHYVLMKLDGRTTADQLAEKVNARFPEQQTTAGEVLAFVKMLQGNGLLLGKGESHGRYLRAIRDTRRKRRRRAAAMGFMYAKVPLLDPDRLLDALYAVLRPFMNQFWMWAAVLFMLASAGAVVLHAERFGELAFPVLGWQNLMMVGVVFFLVKVVHEFGHGLAAKHRGLEVHEMGVMFMLFLPMYYVDVSDAWMVPRRRDRLWISAGGVFIEFIVAAIAAWVWLWTEPGLVNQVAFNVMLATSITTLVFNANPLLKYDGYYFLMDWLEIPNLRAKAGQYLSYLAKRYLLAIPGVNPPPEAARKPIFMPIYAVASSVYRVLVMFGIIALIWHILDPYGLEAIGSLLGLFALGTMVVLPLLKLVRFVWREQAKTWRRAVATLAGAAVLGLVAWAILSIPLEQSVEHPTVALAPQRQPLYVPMSGRVEEVFADDGEALQAGQPILRLVDEELGDKLENTRLRRQTIELNLRMAQRDKKPNVVKVLTAELAVIDSQVAFYSEQLEELTMRAPIAGRLSGPHSLRRMLGTHLKQGEELGVVIGDGPRTIAMVLPQADASIVRQGMPARVRLWAATEAVHEGRVTRVGTQFVEELPHEALSGQYGGEVDILPLEGYKSTPSARSVVAEIVLDGRDPVGPPDGTTGRGKIVIGRSTLGRQQWRTLRQAMSLDWWL